MAFNKKVTGKLFMEASTKIAKDTLEDSLTRGLVALDKAAPKGKKFAKGLIMLGGTQLVDNMVDNPIVDFGIDCVQAGVGAYTAYQGVGAITTFCSAFSNCTEEEAAAKAREFEAILGK